MENKKKAILAVSFGTSFHETREKTIDRIEADLAAAYPEYTLYRAWTSKMIITKLKKRDGIVIPTVAEAVEQMISDGVQELIVQPTHIINGIENDLMKEDVLARKEAFEKIAADHYGRQCGGTAGGDVRISGACRGRGAGIYGTWNYPLRQYRLRGLGLYL